MNWLRFILLKHGLAQRKSGEPYIGQPKSLNEEYIWDVGTAQFIVNVTVKSGGMHKDRFLTIRIADGTDEQDTDEPCIEGDKTLVPPHYIDEFVEELALWRAAPEKWPYRRIDRPIGISSSVTSHIEKVCYYDITKDLYTVELLVKGGSFDGEHILSVFLLDGKNECEWHDPFVEGDSSQIPSEMLEEIFEGLRHWRDNTGDHLQLFT